jgi:hypothetical protein
MAVRAQHTDGRELQRSNTTQSETHQERRYPSLCFERKPGLIATAARLPGSEALEPSMAAVGTQHMGKREAVRTKTDSEAWPWLNNGPLPMFQHVAAVSALAAQSRLIESSHLLVC